MSDLTPISDDDLAFKADREDKSALALAFKTNGRVHIPDFLNSASAKRIHRVLAEQEEWNLVWNNNGTHQDLSYTAVSNWTVEQKQTLSELIHSQARTGFQYHYAAIPIYDIVQQNSMPGHFFNELYEFFNTSLFLDFVRFVTGEPKINFCDMQATRYSSGHFLTEHDDNVHGKNRVAAYVLNLSPEWRRDWGGALVFSDSESDKGEVFFPTYNALNIFSVPQKHAVSFVTPFAKMSRYSITGWFRY